MDDAAAYARWRGARLASEAEFQCAAFGAGDAARWHPWGSAGPSPEHAAAGGFDDHRLPVFSGVNHDFVAGVNF